MKILSFIITVLATTSLVVAQPKLVPLTILHWNDFHAHNEAYKPWSRDFVTPVESEYTVGGSAVFLGYIDKYRKESPHTLVLNAGDDFQGTVVSTVTLGKSQVELMNLINPDAVTLGNHEFDYGSNSLKEHLKIARYPVLVANLYYTQEKKTYVSPTKIVSRGGITIGLIGLTHPELETLVLKDSLVNLTLLNIDSVVSWHVAQFQKQNVNLIVAITHIGLNYDSLLAVKHPELDVIVGGHSHFPLPSPKKINRSIIVQAEKWGRFLGKLDIMFDTQGDSVYSYKGELIETKHGLVDPNSIVAKKVHEMTESVKSAMSVVIGELKTPWERSGEGTGCRESSAGNWQTDTFMEFANTDVAFQNAGGIRKGLQAGQITVGDSWEMNPFGNHCVTFDVTGSTLRAMLEFQVSFASGQECVQIGGIRFVYDSRLPAGQRIVSVEVRGKPLNDTETYSATTNNYVASSFGAHFGVDPKNVRFTSLPKLDRDIIIEKIQKERIIEPHVDGRIQNLANE